MFEQKPFTKTRKWTAPSIFATVVVMLIVSAVGAADRVVLGEYFTSIS